MSAKSARILVVEDEEAMAAGLEYALAREGYEVVLARDGEAAIQALRGKAPDLVLLDIMIPRRSGYDVLRALREEGRSLPVILLTAKGQEADKLRGFDLGADDYVTKPFSLAELLARVRARLKARRANAEPAPDSFALGGALVDLRGMQVRRGSQALTLTLRECDMLRLLHRERGRAVPRSQFLSEVWGDDHFPTTRTVDQHVAKLRQKIEEDATEPRHLLTVFGVGYRLEM